MTENGNLVNVTNNNLENNVKAAKYLITKTRVVSFICAFVLLACGVLLLVLELLEKEGDFFYVFCFVLGFIFLACAIFLPKFLFSVIKKQIQGKESVNTYTFTEDAILIHSDAPSASADETIAYSALYSVKEYKDFWFLYYNKTLMYFVEKSGMREGTEEELSYLLRRKVINYQIKFKIKR